MLTEIPFFALMTLQIKWVKIYICFTSKTFGANVVKFNHLKLH